MFEGHDQAIFELLLEQQLLPSAELLAVRAAAQTQDRSLAAALVATGKLTTGELLAAVAVHLGCGYLREMPAALTGEAIAALPAVLAHERHVVPVWVEGRALTIAAADPFDPELGQELAFALDREVSVCVAEPGRVRTLVSQHYGAADPVSEAKASAAVAGEASNPPDQPDPVDPEQLAGAAPVVQLVDSLLSRAVEDHASDLHFEPFEREFRVRYRVDGNLRELPAPPAGLARPVISRLKVLGNLNIAERRVPQDGRIHFKTGSRAVDLRISTLPTQFGESVVLRVLDQSSIRLSLADLGLPGAVRAGVEAAIGRPNGIFVVTGPTGAGKTTTLYAALQALNQPDVKVLTIEDPVEYEIEGIVQVPVNPAVGLTFPRALRSFLRQDPDVIMVGEIRDLETAQIAVQASLTGHLVLTTLHTNDAPAAVTRLIDLGVEPFLLASTLEGVLAQRLLRRVCSACQAPAELRPEQVAELGLAPMNIAGATLRAGRGCAACRQTGYAGRVAIFEYLPVDDGLRELIATSAPLAALRRHTDARGMVTLRAAANAALLQGQTTAEEVLKYT